VSAVDSLVVTYPPDFSETAASIKENSKAPESVFKP
jgi:hypothetical protein